MAGAGADSAKAKFELPPTYNFPPFFTIQPNDEVRMMQLKEWRDIVIKWHEANAKTSMSVLDWPLFENKRIDREL